MAASVNTKLVCFLIVFAAAPVPVALGVSDFASELVSYGGSFGPSPYNDPCAVLGKPSTVCKNIPGGEPGLKLDPNFRVKLVESAYNVDLNDKKVVTKLNSGATIVVKFDHKVVDYPGNLYGIDFIVFGNSWFEGIGNISDSINMNTYALKSGGQFEQIEVSVSQDGVTWYSFNNGPFADDLFPTQAYQWDRVNARWTDKEMDFTKPVDPNLSYSDFVGISAADAIDLYDGSGGGTGYDLQNLADYNNLAVDPNTGYRWIQYVKLTGTAGSQGVIDAISDVAACGDPTHPCPAGDINKDCMVDFLDFAILAQQWHAGTGWDDLATLAGNWLVCTYNCD